MARRNKAWKSPGDLSSEAFPILCLLLWHTGCMVDRHGRSPQSPTRVWHRTTRDSDPGRPPFRSRCSTRCKTGCRVKCGNGYRTGCRNCSVTVDRRGRVVRGRKHGLRKPHTGRPLEGDLVDGWSESRIFRGISAQRPYRICESSPSIARKHACSRGFSLAADGPPIRAGGGNAERSALCALYCRASI